jgi:spermidine synthase
MIPFKTLAQVRSPDGSMITLHEHDGEHYIKHNGRQLMSTIATVSELLLADLGCRELKGVPKPRILIGGLGLGFTLKRVLELVADDAVVHVSELLPELVDWNKNLLKSVNGLLLKDSRVEVLVQDVFKVMRELKGERYDAILLDVDHTPSSWVQAQNYRIYERAGFDAVHRALKPHGLVAYWSAGEEPEFVQRLGRAGFQVQSYEAKAHASAKRAVHRIYLGAPKARTEAASAPKGNGQGKPARKPSAPQPSARPRAGGAQRRQKPKAAQHPFISPQKAAGIALKERRKEESKGASKR